MPLAQVGEALVSLAPEYLSHWHSETIVLAMPLQQVLQVRVSKAALWNLPVLYVRPSMTIRLSVAKVLLGGGVRGRSFHVLEYLDV
jgi:hypothetical protein